jgi:hypothetical protein
METDYASAPNGFGDTWKRYIEHGIQPGSFGAALVKNDLVGAVGSADPDNIKLIPSHMMWLWNNAPMHCWGSEEAYNQWVARGGLGGEK